MTNYHRTQLKSFRFVKITVDIAIQGQSMGWQFVSNFVFPFWVVIVHRFPILVHRIQTFYISTLSAYISMCQYIFVYQYIPRLKTGLW